MFQSMLADLIAKTPGSEWAMIVGADGVPLETNSSNITAEGEVLAAEFASLFRTCRRVAVQTTNGDLQETVLTTDQGRLVIQTLTPDYFLLLSLDPSGLAGKALFEISRARKALIEELSF